LLHYTCHHCKRLFSSQQVQVNGELMEVPEHEALAKGLSLDV
jgi:hypothetical protein